MTGYRLDGSRFLGRAMTPQMSVLPSRPLATNTSGGSQPLALQRPNVGLLELAHEPTVGAPAQLVNRRHVNAAVRIDEIGPVRRELHRVAAVARRQGDETGAVEVDSVRVQEVRVLTGVLAASPEPDLAFLLVDQVDAPDDVFSPV